MRLSRSLIALVALGSGACASSPPPRPAPQPVEEHDAASEEPAAAHVDEAPPAAGSAAAFDAGERTRPPSTATYEQATATPERLDVDDARPHLTDDQLRGPMRGVITGCGLPPNAKVTIHTAVQNGRAIGVTVDVRFEPRRTPPTPPTKRPSRAAAQRAKAAAEREAKAKKKIATCVDQRVRALVWPPSSRRDSFTTEF